MPLKLIPFLLIILTSCVSTSQNNRSYTEEDLKIIQNLSLRGECEEAERVANAKLNGNPLLVIIAAISNDCLKNTERAIEYLKVAARDGFLIAIRLLIDQGITPPEPTKKVVTINKTYNSYNKPTRVITRSQPVLKGSSSGAQCVQNGMLVDCVAVQRPFKTFNWGSDPFSGFFTP